MKKRKFSAKKIIILALIAAAVIAGLFLFLFRGDGLTETYLPYEVKQGDVRRTLSFSGVAKVKNEKLVYANYATKVRTVYVREGEEISVGSKLVLLENGKLIVSDMDGYVGKINVIEQQYVTENTSLLVLYDLSDMAGEFDVNEYEIPEISIGQDCRVTISSSNEVIYTKISSINMNADTEGGLAKYKVGADLNGMNRIKLLPGMQLHMDVDTKAILNCTYIPAEAVAFDEQNNPYVYVWRNNRYEIQPVYVALYSGNLAAIQYGLDGETVVYARVWTGGEESDMLSLF